MPTQQTGTCEGLYYRSFWVECLECGARGPTLDKENALSEWELIAKRFSLPPIGENGQNNE